MSRDFKSNQSDDFNQDNDCYDLLHIVIRNSNPGNKVAFTLDQLKSIIDYKRFHGSKVQNSMFLGLLMGNATKDYLTMSYALINSIANTEQYTINNGIIH